MFHPSHTRSRISCDLSVLIIFVAIQASKDSREEIMKIFKLFDEDNIGSVV